MVIGRSSASWLTGVGPTRRTMRRTCRWFVEKGSTSSRLRRHRRSNTRSEAAPRDAPAPAPTAHARHGTAPHQALAQLSHVSPEVKLRKDVPSVDCVLIVEPHQTGRVCGNMSPPKRCLSVRAGLCRSHRLLLPDGTFCGAPAASRAYAVGPALKLEFGHQLGGVHPEGGGQAEDVDQGDVALASLD